MASLGHQVHVFHPLLGTAHERTQSIEDGVHLWRVPLPASRQSEGPVKQYWHTFRSRDLERAFSAFLDEAQPGLVHFQHVQGVSARLIALAAGRPRVLTVHDYWTYCANSQLVRPDRTVCTTGPGLNCVDCATARADLGWMRLVRPLVALPFAYRNAYLRRMLAQIDLFISPSHFLRQQYAQRGLPPERILVMENGLDLTRFASTPDPLPAPPARPHFGFLGSLAWQKGVHVLVAAFNQLGGRGALSIYGSTSLFPDYLRELQRDIRHPNVRLCGALPHSQIGSALKQLDYLVVPSVWFENSPLVIQEAYAFGVPVIASRLGALPEKVLEGQTGRLFAPGDSVDLARVLRDLIDHPGERERLSRGIQPGPTIGGQATQLGEIYQGLVRNGPRA